MKKIVQPLLQWYQMNKRILPWRDRHNAYYTWVSEIMLQQTRVEAVKPYFERFIEKLPTVEALRDCEETQLLKLWEGLGYYNRVRNMQKAAAVVCAEYGGELPHDVQTLLLLPGIGSYTAGAIASIAYQQPVPAVDGNVLRVLSRLQNAREDILLDKTKRAAEQTLQEIISSEAAQQAGDFNQAMMELGALVCLPQKAAKCDACPLASCCLAREHKTVEELPVRIKKVKRKIEERTVLLLDDGTGIAISKRADQGLLAGLYELPNLSGSYEPEEVLEYVKEIGLFPLHIQQLAAKRHLFSHVEWRMIGYKVRIEALRERTHANLLFLDRRELLTEYPIPSAFEGYLSQIRESLIV
ncbi:MAG: A/G-specific adenine glycosylase [Lachnospiraceae bacterium]